MKLPNSERNLKGPLDPREYASQGGIRREHVIFAFCSVAELAWAFRVLCGSIMMLIRQGLLVSSSACLREFWSSSGVCTKYPLPPNAVMTCS